MAKKRYKGRFSEDKEKYNKYLASREWSVKKQAVMKRAKGYCERCLVNEAVMVHHLTYIRKYHELLTDLQAICEPCHRWIHALSDYDPLDPKLRK